jgi:hypothetical protein
MNARAMYRSTVGAQGSEGGTDGPPTAGRRGSHRVRRTALLGTGGVALAALVAGALTLPAGSGSGTGDRSGASPVVAGLSCYLPTAGAAAVQPAGPGGGPAASTPAPRVPALYGLEQVAAHTICR